MIPALLTSCQSTDKKASIINSKYFFLDAEEQMASEDPMVEFEKKHLLHGAISQKKKIKGLVIIMFSIGSTLIGVILKTPRP